MKIVWSDAQASLLRTIAPNVDPSCDLDDDDLISLTEEIGHHAVLHGVDAQDNPNETGILCEGMLDKILSALADNY